MSISPSSPSVATVFGALLPIMAAVLIGFLVIGAAVPVLPLDVHNDLKFNPFIVGLVTGSQFAASLPSRVWAGRTCDRYGLRRAVVVGLIAGIAAGLFYLGLCPSTGQSALSVVILLAGRGVLGAAESFIITVWGLARVGAHDAGKVMAWIGTAMFAAIAGGAPLGLASYSRVGFGAVATATVLAPLATIALVIPLRAVVSERK